MIFLLLVLFQAKHFLADYPLQGKYMLGKFKTYPDFIMPLLAHSAVHGLFTFLIAICFKGVSFSLFLAALDMGIHFAVDRVKASPEMLGKYKPLTKSEYIMHNSMLDSGSQVEREVSSNAIKSNTYFWWALGADQTAHHLTHYVLIWLIL